MADLEGLPVIGTEWRLVCYCEPTLSKLPAADKGT